MLLENMLSGVLSHAEGCPELLAVQAMRKACIEWCNTTYSLTTGARVQSTAGGSIEPVDMGQYYFVAVVDARIDGIPVAVVPVNDERIATACEEHPVLFGADPMSLHIVPEPATPIFVDLLVALSPGPEATEVPDILWQRHFEALERGALARLLAQPKKPWSDPSTATWHATQFQDAITKAAALNGRNRLTNAMRLRVKPY